MSYDDRDAVKEFHRGVGDQVRQLRARAKVTQSGLSKRGKVSQATLSRIEAAEGSPTIATLLSIASAFRASLEIRFTPSTESGDAAAHAALLKSVQSIEQATIKLGKSLDKRRRGRLPK